jgi:hypothetical protein
MSGPQLLLMTWHTQETQQTLLELATSARRLIAGCENSSRRIESEGF